MPRIEHGSNDHAAAGVWRRDEVAHEALVTALTLQVELDVGSIERRQRLPFAAMLRPIATSATDR